MKPWNIWTLALLNMIFNDLRVRMAFKWLLKAKGFDPDNINRITRAVSAAAVVVTQVTIYMTAVELKEMSCNIFFRVVFFYPFYIL